MKHHRKLAVGLLVSAASQAGAAPLPEFGPVRLQVRGVDLRVGGGASLQGGAFRVDGSGAGSPDGNVDLFGEANAEWTSPGGILVGFNIKASNRERETEQLETGEAYLFFASERGRVEIGRQDGPADTLSFHAPVIALGQIRGDSARYAGTRALLSPLDTQDAFKVIYLSPPVRGFRGGVSWSPEVKRNPEAPDPRARTLLRNAVELALQYQQPVGAWILGASGAWARGNADPETGRADLNSWSVGGEARRGPLRIGGAYVDRGDSNRLDRGFNQREVNAGVAWVTDRWGLAASASRQKASTRTDRSVAMGGFYRLTRNIEFRADVNRFDLTRPDRPRRKGIVGVAEVEFSF